MNEEVEVFEVFRVRSNKKDWIEDAIIKEAPLTIFLNGEELVTLLCTPRDQEYLAVGFLATEGFIRKKEDIRDIQIDKTKGIIELEVDNSLMAKTKDFGKRIIPSGCGRGVLFHSIRDTLGCIPAQTNTRISSNKVVNLIRELQRSSFLFKMTGGVHSCALCDTDGIIEFSQDIGRHNALDKVLGRCFLGGVSPEGRIILTTGRVSYEILAKSAKWGIPIIVSRGAATSLAVRLAEKLRVTLIGFARGGRMNIYTHSERITTD
jgi:FdhD protein